MTAAFTLIEEKTMSRSRTKKNQRAITPQIQQNPNPGLKKQLDKLEDDYKNTYMLFHLQREKNLICKIEDESIINVHITLMHEMFENITQSIHDLVIEEEIVTNAALLLYCKIKALFGQFMITIGHEATGLALYMDVARCVSGHDKYLEYKNDVFFQEQMASVFDVLENTQIHLDQNVLQQKPEVAVQIAKNKNDVKSAHNVFKKKCGTTIVSVTTSHNELEKSYIAGHTDNIPWEKLNRTYKNNRDAFFALARNLKASFEQMQRNNTFSTLYQVHDLRLNYLMMNMEELTHPNHIWIVKKTKDNQIEFFCRELKRETIKDHFNFWSSLKDKYIIPSLSLIENINENEIRNSVGLYMHYTKQLNAWLSVFLMTMIFYTKSIESLIKEVENHKTLSEDFKNEICERASSLIEEEIKFLIPSTVAIKDAAEKTGCKLEGGFIKNSDAILDQVDIFEARVNKLASCMEEREKEKSRLAAKMAEELIREETQKKEESAKKKAEKARERQLRNLQSFKQMVLEKNEYQPEMYEDEDEKALSTVTLISPLLQDLMEIDRAAMKLSDTLQSKCLGIVKFIRKRLNDPVQLASRCQGKMFYNIKNMLVEYHELLVLLDKHKNLSRPVIAREAELSAGIAFSHDVLEQRRKEIYQDIQSFLKIIEDITAKQKASLKEYIYKLGKENAAPDATDKEIRRMGEKILGKIGEEKRANQLEFSEYTKQKHFLQGIKLNLSGLEYLQEQSRPCIYGQAQALCEQGLFGQVPVEQRAGISEEVFECMLGFIFKQQYEDRQGSDIECLKRSLLHFQRAYAAAKNECRLEGVKYISDLMAGVESMLNQHECKQLKL
jgi:hypothetical protein